ncbi:MAG: hypothetical protein ACLTDP_06955 [Terrisporobacter sp.]
MITAKTLKIIKSHKGVGEVDKGDYVPLLKQEEKLITLKSTNNKTIWK